MTTSEFAAKHGYTKAHVRCLIEQGVLPAVRLGPRGKWLISDDAIATAGTPAEPPLPPGQRMALAAAEAQADAWRRSRGWQPPIAADRRRRRSNAAWC